MTIMIPLNLLRISPLNARKTPPRAAEQAELAASIVAHGLLENLIVRPTDTEHYDVLAGGRRLMALQSLVSEGKLEADHPIACLVHDGDPQEVSLAENVVRLSMHALDQFEAFAALADQGLSVIEIASRFGNTETLVRQRLRLGRVAPEIRAAYRADDITLDTLTAFAVTEDHGQQLAVWEQVKDDYINAHHVRRLLTDEKIAATSKFVRFIGQDAYDAAGDRRPGGQMGPGGFFGGVRAQAHVHRTRHPHGPQERPENPLVKQSQTPGFVGVVPKRYPLSRPLHAEGALSVDKGAVLFRGTQASPPIL